MPFKLKKYKHAPAHLFIDKTYYFFTGAIYKKRRLLTTAKTKEIFIDKLIYFCEKYKWRLLEWVVLENHYHFLAKIENSQDMPVVINSLHKTTAFYIKKELNIKIKPFWYQYWDRWIRDDKHYYETSTYILYNPIKHNYVKDLNEYPFSSFPIRKREEEENLRKYFMKHRPQDVRYYNEIDDF
jgi:putative transposase